MGIGAGLKGLGTLANAIMKGTKLTAAATKNINRVGRFAGTVATAGSLAYVEGTMSGGSVYKQTYEELLRSGVDQETAAKRAQIGAAAAARISMTINTALNMTGLKSI